MNQHHAQSDAWQPCQGGELQQLADRQRRQGLRRATAIYGGAVAAIVALVVVGVFALQAMQNGGEYHYGGIACTDVKKVLRDYASGKLAAEDADKARQIKIHLEKCPACGPLYREMIQPTARRGHSPDLRAVRHCPCCSPKPAVILAAAWPRTTAP